MAHPGPRTFWLSRKAVAGLLLFIILFTYFFLIDYITLPSLKDTLFYTSERPPASWHFQSAQVGGWLIFILCLGFVTPFLELLTWVPAPSRPAWLRRLIIPSASLTPSPVRKASSVAAISNDASKSPAPRPTLVQRFVPAWMLHLSPSAWLFLFLWQGAIYTSWLVPYGYRYLYLDNPDNTRLHSQMSRTDDVSYFWRVIHALGRTAGWPNAVAMAIVMIPASRTSAWLEALNMSPEEALMFHRLFAWDALWWTTIHAVFQHASWLAVSEAAWRNELLPNTYYNAHTDRAIASVGWFIYIFLGLVSTPWARRRFYNLFRLSHLSILVMMPLLIMHEYYLFFWQAYGGLLYAADLAQRWVINGMTTTAVLTAVEDKVTRVTLQPNGRHMRPDPTWAGKVVYLRIGRVSWWETHPFSISSVSGNTITLHVAACGNWTNKMFALAREAGPEGLEVRAHLEGPYGGDLAGELVAHDSVVLIAGGIGITPIASLLQQLLTRSYNGTLIGARVHLLWVVRRASMAKMLPYNLLQRAAATAGFTVRIFVTSEPAAADTYAVAPDAPASADEPPSPVKLDKLDQGANHVVLPMPSSRSSSSLATWTTEITPFRAFMRRFTVKAILVWVATLAIVAGYVIACQIVYTQSGALVLGTARTAAVERIYNTTSLENYYRNQTGLAAGAPLPANASAVIAKYKWPKAQPVWSKVQPTGVDHILFGTVTLCFSCSDTRNPSTFPFGMEPFICCNARVPIAMTFIRVLFPLFFSLVIAVAAAICCRWAISRYWPLHTASDDVAASAAAVAAEHRSSGSGSNPGTDEAVKISLDKLPTCSSLELGPDAVQYSQGRPSFPVELAALAKECPGRMVIYTCGPVQMRDALRYAVYKGVTDLAGCPVLLREFSFE